MTRAFPPEVISQHVAILGKTGAGKSHTARVLVEQVVKDAARVCVLDPIKSDWWGLTSSADGRRPGLPFHILGGPRGHVPLHASAGKAVAEIVASGALPLSIIDMADFAPGGQAKFFVDFAPTLLRKMRGVVYLVIEEAHLFAPKERAGFRDDNMAIHWSKTLATAGRSKGIRLIVLSQRVQALHNAVLGSCDTLIAHRLTAPADQEPVLKWLKANASADVLEQVRSSLSSLKTGHGWICSGEAKLFEPRSFPRIQTYDNTATPTGDGDDRIVKTAPVDQERLRAIIGEAVAEAEANDPALLKQRIQKLEAENRRLSTQAPAAASAPEVRTETVLVLNEEDRRQLADVHAAMLTSSALLTDAGLVDLVSVRAELTRALDQHAADIKRLQAEFVSGLTSLRPLVDKLGAASIYPGAARPATPTRTVPEAPIAPARHPRMTPAAGTGDVALGRCERALLTVLRQRSAISTSKVQLAVLSGYSVSSSGFQNALGKLRTLGLVSGFSITDAGCAAIGQVPSRPKGQDLVIHWMSQLGKAEATMLNALVNLGGPMTREDLSNATGYSTTSSGFQNAIGRLRSLGLATQGWPVSAGEELLR